MPLAAYFDASGHEDDQKVVVVAGFVATPEMWLEFDSQWKARLAQDGIKYFHAVEFAHSNKQFEGWREQRAKRELLLENLMDIIKANVSRKFVSAVIIEALNENMTAETKEKLHINAYSLAGRTCAGRLRAWQDRERWTTVPELIFEDGDKGKGLLRTALLRDGFSEPIFRPKINTPAPDELIREGLTPLQAADWLAYEMFLACRDQRENRWPFSQFLTTPGDMGVYLARDIERLEALLNAPADVAVSPEYWEELKLRQEE